LSDKPNTGLDQRIYLWVDKDKKLTANNIRDNFAQKFSTIIGPKLFTSTYRHVAIAFMEKYIKGYQIDITFHLQAGHSVETAMLHYANSNLDLTNLDRNSYEAFSRCSLQWQQLLGLVEENVIDSDSKSVMEKVQYLDQKFDLMDQSNILKLIHRA
jgi:hypothetical protein